MVKIEILAYQPSHFQSLKISFQISEICPEEMEDKLQPQEVSSSKPDEYSQTPSGDDQWTPTTPASVLTITLKQPEKPDTLEFTPQGDEQKPLDEDVTFTIQVKKTPDSPPEPYSPQENGLPEVSQEIKPVK